MDAVQRLNGNGLGREREGLCVSLSLSLSGLSYSLIPRESVPVKKRHHVWHALQGTGPLSQSDRFGVALCSVF